MADWDVAKLKNRKMEDDFGLVELALQLAVSKQLFEGIFRGFECYQISSPAWKIDFSFDYL